jgi:hypothetical protein
MLIAIIKINFIEFSDKVLTRNKKLFSFSWFKLIKMKIPVITIAKPTGEKFF